jgi:glycosyltransferase involved in cell wall biosynthesis
VVEAAPLVLFFGKIEPYKGLDLLLEAWADVRVPRARLLIAGMCPDRAYASRIREGIAALGADSGITWREGFIPNEDLGMLLTACDVAVLPYRHIYQSGVVFLCMRFGVPIIASQVGSMPEYVTPSNGLLVSPVEALSFARAIDDFFAHQDRFSRAEIAASSAKYEWAVQCRSILALY